MAAPRLPREEILQWLREGKTQKEVVALLAQRGIEAKQTSVSRIKLAYGDKYGLTKGAPRSEYIPWELAPEHRSLYPAQMLRYLDRQRRGEGIPPMRARQLAAWLAALDEDDASIHYDPDTAQGFWRLPRRSGETVVRYPDREATGV